MSIRKIFHGLLSALIVFIGATLPVYAKTFHFKSPTGKYEVFLQEVWHKKFSPDAQQKDVDNISHVKYKINFQYAGTSKALASVEYHDVYGWMKDAEPLPPHILFRGLVWSPREDFVILPEEGWAGAPGSAVLKAVALTPGLIWSSATFHLDNVIWVDNFRAVGDIHDDCNFAVNLFDGITGKTTPIKESKSPMGYEIKLQDGRQVLIKKVLDNCRLEEDAQKFKPECTLLDLDTMKTMTEPCTMGEMSNH